MAALDHVTLDLHILISKLGRCGIVCIDAAHLGCCQDNHIRLFFFEEITYLLLVGQIQLSVCSSNNIGVALGFEVTHNCAPNQSPMSGHINLICFFPSSDNPS